MHVTQRHKCMCKFILDKFIFREHKIISIYTQWTYHIVNQCNSSGWKVRKNCQCHSVLPHFRAVYTEHAHIQIVRVYIDLSMYMYNSSSSFDCLTFFASVRACTSKWE